MRLIRIILFAFLLSQPAAAQELTLYIVPSPVQIDWSSPAALMRTTLVNQFKESPGLVSYPLGHIYVGLRNGEKGEEILTGMTRNRPNSANRKVFRKGYGMGILFADIEGRLQTTEEVRESLESLFSHGEVSFISFGLSDETYLRLINYFNSYNGLGLGSVYNGLNRPREGLGAGCAKFAISFLEVAGIDFSLWTDEWSEQVAVPDRLIGGLGINNRHVSLLQLIFSSNWAKAGEKSYSFEVFEPYNMHQWVLNIHYSESHLPEVEPLWIQNSPGVKIDLRHHSPPDSPIFVSPHLNSDHSISVD